MTADHFQELPTGAALVAAARAALESSGERWTDMRALVYETLVAFGRPASAYEIADHMSAARDRRVAPNSIYRILDVLAAANVVLRVELATGYFPNPHPGCAHNCILLVCSVCSSATHFDECHITAYIQVIAQQFKFDPAPSVIEVKGRCKACSVASCNDQ